jgi:hypothetical protein
MPLSDTFDKLKSSVLGVKTTKIDRKLDKAVRDISMYKSQSGRNGYIDLVRSVISKSGQIDIGAGSQGLFGQAATPAMMGQGGRLMRYRTYEAIVYNISYCYRALSVLVDNILSPDDITKIALDIKPVEKISEEVSGEIVVNLVQEIIKSLKLEQNLTKIVRNTLEFGDYFCEIADTKTALTSRAIIAEYHEYIDSNAINTDKETLVIDGLGESKLKNIKFIMDYSSFTEAEDMTGKNVDDDDSEKNLKDVHLVFHEGKFVVKLQSDLFPICFGYLVFPRALSIPQLAVQDQIVNNICVAILKNVEKRIPQAKELQDNEDLKDIIKSMIVSSDYSRSLNIRYVPPDKMEHFHVPSDRYFPYGESIFDPCQFNAKVLIALETALAIHRLTRSIEKRKIAIEIGLPRDAKKAIEKMKEEFRKRKISLDSFGTVDTIPSMITTFEDIYIPQKDGKAFVDVSTFNEGGTDVRGKVDELKFLRDSIVACLGVPASFLNIEENLSNKAALSEENILFARTIVGHQKYFTHQVNSLLYKVIEIVKPDIAIEILDAVLIAFAPPKSLQFEREARYLSDLANMIDTLERIGIPKEYAKRKYLSQIDWSDVAKYQTEEDIEKGLGTEKEEEEPGFGGGGAF